MNDDDLLNVRVIIRLEACSASLAPKGEFREFHPRLGPSSCEDAAPSMSSLMVFWIDCLCLSADALGRNIGFFVVGPKRFEGPSFDR
jgi:hypothetical protein